MLAAEYTNDSGENYSIYYKSNDQEGYFDMEGRPARKSFLKSPVKYSKFLQDSVWEISPNQKVNIPHYGTDYAAPYGTEIRAVADGIIGAASYKVVMESL